MLNQTNYMRRLWDLRLLDLRLLDLRLLWDLRRLCPLDLRPPDLRRLCPPEDFTGSSGVVVPKSPPDPALGSPSIFYINNQHYLHKNIIHKNIIYNKIDLIIIT